MKKFFTEKMENFPTWAFLLMVVIVVGMVTINLRLILDAERAKSRANSQPGTTTDSFNCNITFTGAY